MSDQSRRKWSLQKTEDGQRFLDKCRHFTGIQHKTCAAGVAYDLVRDVSESGPARWPCLETKTGRCVDNCPKRSLLSQEEHVEHYRQLDAAVDEMLAKVAAGKCHVCGADAEPSKIVGRCKYAACGHRIGQAGTLAAEGLGVRR